MKCLNLFNARGAKLICCALAFSALPALAQDYWRQMNGPFGGSVHEFVRNARGDLFAGADGGLFRSRDQGATWQRLPLGEKYGDVFHLFITSWDDIYAWAFSHKTVLRSNDQGDTWQVVISFSSLDIGVLAEDSEGKLYAPVPQHGLYVSNDRGGDWRPFALEGESVTRLFFSEQGTWLAPFNGGLWRSRDRGRTWQWVPIEGARFYQIVNHPSYILFAAAQETGIFRSNDDGESWEKIGSALPRSYVDALVLDHNNYLWTGLSFDGVYCSTDQGETWQPRGLNEETVAALHVDAGGNFFAGTLRGVFVSHDADQTWNETNFGLTSANVFRLVTDSKGNVFAQVRGSEQLLRSTDHGETWKVVHEPQSAALAIRSDDVIFAGISGGVVRSRDHGENWESFLTLPRQSIPGHLVFGRSGEIYLTTFDNNATRGIIYKSSDDGATWTAVGKASTEETIGAFALDENDNFYLATESGKVLYSDDAGKTWQTRYAKNSYQSFPSLVIKPFGQIYLGGRDGVLHSSDYGRTWRNLLPQTYVLALACDEGGYMVAATGDGIYISNDAGRNWQLENSGMSDHWVWSVAKSSDGYVYAGTQSFGVFRSQEKVLSLPERAALVRNYPNPFNGGTRLDFALPQAGFVRLAIYSVLGQELDVLVEQPLSAGKYSVRWTREDLPSGVYFSRLQVGGEIFTNKMLLVR